MQIPGTVTLETYSIKLQAENVVLCRPQITSGLAQNLQDKCSQHQNADDIHKNICFRQNSYVSYIVTVAVRYKKWYCLSQPVSNHGTTPLGDKKKVSRNYTGRALELHTLFSYPEYNGCQEKYLVIIVC